MRQFFLERDDDREPRPGDRVTLDREESHHVLTVLRKGDDAPVGLVDGRGWRLTARLVDRARKLATLEVLGAERDAAEDAPPRLHLACGVVKGRRWEWVLEKAVELGAHRITPLLTEHGVVEPRDRRRERWLAVLRGALKQSRRCRLPVLDEPIDPAGFLAARGEGPLWFGAVPDERGGVTPAPEAPETAAWLTVAVGPEGGWSSAERQDLVAAGAQPLDLGPHVLRTETAAAAGLVVLQGLRRTVLDRPAGGGI